jgi:hypothetical protein
MTLHLSQIFRTLALTFIASSGEVADTLRLAQCQSGDDAATWIETGPLDQYTLPRPNVHTDAPGVLRETGREDSSSATPGVLGFEAVEVLGQLSNHGGLESGDVQIVHVDLKSAEGGKKPRPSPAGGAFAETSALVSLDQARGGPRRSSSRGARGYAARPARRSPRSCA